MKIKCCGCDEHCTYIDEENTEQESLYCPYFFGFNFIEGQGKVIGKYKYKCTMCSDSGCIIINNCELPPSHCMVDHKYNGAKWRLVNDWWYEK